MKRAKLRKVGQFYQIPAHLTHSLAPITKSLNAAPRPPGALIHPTLKKPAPHPAQASQPSSAQRPAANGSPTERADVTGSAPAAHSVRPLGALALPSPTPCPPPTRYPPAPCQLPDNNQITTVKPVPSASIAPAKSESYHLDTIWNHHGCHQLSLSRRGRASPKISLSHANDLAYEPLTPR